MIKDTITFRQITPEMAKHAEIQGFNLVATLKSIIQETWITPEQLNFQKFNNPQALNDLFDLFTQNLIDPEALIKSLINKNYVIERTKH